ncbi:hypothetical protein Glove_139g229 [Diversispora epigaea]|uniref:Uncharacterized protein n=1 Tax=Diversispora epigaea TaxID=1348612 RepID=A0A397J5P2_9GLOM|nr:hypothetical protein Glove_139g229 [Diversispora epigaea]
MSEVTEAYTPPLYIDPYEQKKGNDAIWIRSLVIKPHLASKSDYTNTIGVSFKNLCIS